MYQAIPSCSLLSIYGFLPKCRSVKYLLLDITQEEVWKQNIIAHRESVDIFEMTARERNEKAVHATILVRRQHEIDGVFKTLVA